MCEKLNKLLLWFFEFLKWNAPHSPTDYETVIELMKFFQKYFNKSSFISNGQIVTLYDSVCMIYSSAQRVIRGQQKFE